MLADYTALLAVIVAGEAFGVGGIAVAALGAMHIFNLPAALAEAAAVAKSAHTVGAEPAEAAKLILGDIMAFVAAQTVPAVIYIAILAGETLRAVVCQFIASAAFAAMGSQITRSVCTLFAAGTAGAAAIIVPMVMVAHPAVLTVLIICVNVGCG